MAPQAICYNPPLVCDKPLGAPAYCETHLLWLLQSYISKFQTHINSLAPWKFEWHLRYLIFQIISVIDGSGISCELALRWMSQCWNIVSWIPGNFNEILIEIWTFLFKKIHLKMSFGKRQPFCQGLNMLLKKKEKKKKQQRQRQRTNKHMSARSVTKWCHSWDDVLKMCHFVQVLMS